MVGKALVLALPAWLAAAAPLGAQAAGDSPRKVYEKVAESVVAIRVLAPLGERSGSGVVLSKDGLLLTSYSVCPEGSSKIRVWVKGPRLYDGEIVGTSRKDELALLRIKPRGELKPVELGSSGTLRVGDVSYSIGNAANSIILDDQPSFNVGVVSGLYRLNEDRASAWYTGPVIETTAAVNVGMEGAPCLDAAGRMVGLLSLNYSPHRFLGAAIPIDDLKPVIDRLQKASTASENPDTSAGEGSLGLTLKDEGGRVVVASVEKGGPADREGLQKGDVIAGLGETPVKSAREVLERLKGLEAGSVLWLKIDVGGKQESVKITLEKKK
jgi:S1-C subfamily serine protease